MWEQDCGAIPILDEESRVIAMLTDRDLCMAAYTQGRWLGQIPIESAMSRQLFSCHPQDDVKTAEKTMRERRVRRLPVVDDEGRLAGILSLSDLSREALKEVQTGSRKKDVRYAEIGETLSAITGMQWLAARSA